MTPDHADDRQPHIHIPYPGDHYSPATGSAIMTIIHQMAKARASRGGETRVIVGRGTRHDYEAGGCVEVEADPTYPSRRERLIDAALGRVGLPRVYTPGRYRPACAAIDPDFAGHVIVHNTMAPAVLIAEQRPRAKVSLWANNQLLRSYGRREARRAVRALHRVICCSEFIAGDVRAKAGPDDRIRVVHNGVDVEQFHPAEARAPRATPVIVFLGRMQPEKGPHLLLEAGERLKARGTPFRLRIVGSSSFSATDPLNEYERGLRRMSQALGDAVEFVPFVERRRVADVYRDADIFCAPAIWNDPCPLTIPEGMASGIPVVTTRRGGIPEVGGDAVRYFAPPDSAELARVLEELLSDPAARAAWGARARRRAETFAWERQYDQLLHALD